MESIENASKDELLETIELLKEENEKTVDELLEKLRSIEGEQLKTNISNRQMEGKIRELKGEINSFKKTPLILATVTEVFDDNQVGIQGAVGHEFLVTYPDSIKKELLVPGARVALNQKNLGVVSVFPAKKVEPPRLLRRRGFANLKKKHYVFLGYFYCTVVPTIF